MDILYWERTKKNLTNAEGKLTNAEIAATKADLTEAERQRKEELVLTLTNLLVKLYDKEARIEARVEARLSAGEIYCNRSVCDLVLFLSI
jgi:hypothetical protein